MAKNKYLIIDASSWEPLRFSLTNGTMTVSELNTLFSQADVTPVITKTAYLAGEFNFSEQPTIFDAYENNFLTFSSETNCINSEDVLVSSATVQPNGTLTAKSLYSDDDLIGDSLNFLIFDSTLQPQMTLWEMNNEHWQALSESDKSAVHLARYFCSVNQQAGILANDWDLRAQCFYEGIEVYGTASLLAGMFLSGTYSCQKATGIFYKWKDYDKKFVPKKSFKEVLSIERKRAEKDKILWV